MKTIYKYSLPVARENVQVTMPMGAKLLHLDYHTKEPDVLCIWAEVDPAVATVTRFFQVRGTGHRLGELIELDGRYVGTVLIRELGLVWHVYEVKP